MTTAFEIPLSPKAQRVTIPLAGVTYTLTFRWNSPASCWILDIADANGNPILSGIPLVTGTDLLKPFGYLNFGGQLIVQSDNNTFAVPQFADLGVNGHLYFVTG